VVKPVGDIDFGSTGRIPSSAQLSGRVLSSQRIEEPLRLALGVVPAQALAFGFSKPPSHLKKMPVKRATAQPDRLAEMERELTA
jgi:hypothetical protein